MVITKYFFEPPPPLNSQGSLHKKKKSHQSIGQVFICCLFFLELLKLSLTGSEFQVPEDHVPHVSLLCHFLVHPHFIHKIRTKQYQIKWSLK